MKTFQQLNSEEKKSALNKCVNSLLTAICEGAVRFNDALNGDNLQSKIDAAFEKAEKMRTPWFSHEYIMDTCRAEIESMAQCDAEDSLYSAGEIIISGVCVAA